MSAFNTISLLINGLTVALALGFLIIVLWHDTRKQLNQFFAIFLFLVTLWNVGLLLSQIALLIEPDTPLLTLVGGIMDVGFTGSSIAVYTLTAILVGINTKRFQILAFSSLLLVIGYRLLLIVTNPSATFQATTSEVMVYQFPVFSILFYTAFDGLTFYLVWRYRRKIRSSSLRLSILAFVIGQSLGFLNPELQSLSLSVSISSIAALLMSFAILRQEIITPLAERVEQVEALHKVSLAVTSQIALNTVLEQIATQAVGWLDADAAGIFLVEDDCLRLATVYNLPQAFLETQIPMGQEGVAGKVAQTRQSIHLDNYGRDWRGVTDLPMAQETFGSVVCVPLIYGNEAIGVLMVIAGKHGRLFNRDDVHLLELLSSQAAVAIAHSRFFEEQSELTHQVEAARSQLETVLVSTENPVLAVDRGFRLIFANPVAKTLFSMPDNFRGAKIEDVLPSISLPTDFQSVMSELRRKRVYIYEIAFEGRFYQCHLACLGRPRIAGWVAILNDVSQLKELDRIKSEMVRMTSHDLKNPLQAAMANLELLSDDVAHLKDVEVQQSVKAIEKQLDRMNRIIGGILDLERVKTGTPRFELCYPSKIIDNCVDELRHLAVDQRIRLEISIEANIPCFLGDAEQFERALINLIENAIKFTKPGGEVEISVKSQENQVIFRVKDTGIGIPLTLHDRIFDRFFRGMQQGAEHISGSGLGLSLVKAIVDNHHGTIWLESKENTGTTFFVAIPAVIEIVSQK
jgi:signal transduction histidine kinase